MAIDERAGDEVLTIRRAGESDIAAVHQLVEGAYRGGSARGGWTHEADLLGGQRTDEAAIADMLADSSQFILVATAPASESALVGCVHVQDKGEGLAYLGLLSVAPARQADGLGRRLIAAAEAEAIAAFAARRMEMTVIRQRSELIDYYIRRGYRPTGETRPFPYGDERFGQPRVGDLSFVVLARGIG